MLTTETIEDLFRQTSHADGRWLFTPKLDSPLSTHRYGLTFLPPERRFLLSRARVEKFITVDDDELVEAFRRSLSDEAIAECTRRAMHPQPEDDIPF